MRRSKSRRGGAALGLALSLLALAGACTRVKVQSRPVPELFKSLRSYNWAPPVEEAAVSDDARVDMRLLEARIRRAVDRELGLRGFRRAFEDPADFLIRNRSVLEARSSVANLSRGRPGPLEAGMTGIPMPEQAAHRYEEGSLTLDFIDPESRRVLWRGTARANVNVEHDSEATRRQRIKQAVEKLLAGFPDAVEPQR